MSIPTPRTILAPAGTPRAVEPPPSRWSFPPSAAAIATVAAGHEIAGVGADLEPGTLLAAYRSGVFPMPVRAGVLGWWSPDPRGVIILDRAGSALAGAGETRRALMVSRSLRRSCKRFEITVDAAFGEVIDACADRRRPGGWIDKRMKAAYRRLHELGWAHSVEAWGAAGELAGGLYGVAIGGFFAGESMFHRRTDASKVALVALGRLLDDAGAVLVDVQWATPHLRSLGAVEVSRALYHQLLEKALGLPQPCVFGGG